MGFEKVGNSKFRINYKLTILVNGLHFSHGYPHKGLERPKIPR